MPKGGLSVAQGVATIANSMAEVVTVIPLTVTTERFRPDVTTRAGQLKNFSPGMGLVTLYT